MSAEDMVDIEGEEKGETTESKEGEDQELEALKKRVKEMEEEDEKFRKMQEEIDGSQDSDVDSRSIYVGQVDYTTTPEELQQHFSSSGTINRVTILCDKWTGHPKGYAYVEFADKESVQNAVVLNGTLFKGRQLKVTPKRTNIPGLGKMRGRGRGRGRARGFNPYFSPRARGFRGRARGYYY